MSSAHPCGNECGRCDKVCFRTSKPSDGLVDWDSLEEFLKEPCRGDICCIEALAIHCCSGNLACTIFYNTDRIEEWIDYAAQSIAMVLSKDLNNSKTNLPRLTGLSLPRLQQIVRGVFETVGKTYLMAHERYHWAEGCSRYDSDSEARAEAYAIYSVINDIRGLRNTTQWWEPRLNSGITHDATTLLLLEYSVDFLVAQNMYYSGYNEFAKYLDIEFTGPKMKLGRARIEGQLGFISSLAMSAYLDATLTLPWIGLRTHTSRGIVANTEEIHRIKFKGTTPTKQYSDELKEKWKCCNHA